MTDDEGGSGAAAAMPAPEPLAALRKLYESLVLEFGDTTPEEAELERHVKLLLTGAEILALLALLAALPSTVEASRRLARVLREKFEGPRCIAPVLIRGGRCNAPIYKLTEDGLQECIKGHRTPIPAP